MCINFKFMNCNLIHFWYIKDHLSLKCFLFAKKKITQRFFTRYWLHVNFKRNVLVFYNNGYNSIPIGNRCYCDALLLWWSKGKLQNLIIPFIASLQIKKKNYGTWIHLFSGFTFDKLNHHPYITYHKNHRLCT